MNTRYLYRSLILLTVLSAVAVAVAVMGVSYRVECTRYELSSDKITDSLKLVVVADFHGCRYGGHSEEILRLITAEEPDIVLLCGDIYDDGLPFDRSDELVRQLADRWPAYYVSGNHEYWSGSIDSIKSRLTDYGVHVLGGTAESVTVGNDTIFIGGIDDPTYLGVDVIKNQAESIHFPPKRFSILLSHRPELTGLFATIPVDLVVSGHAHGGQVRIPHLLDNGLIAPNQGLFPKYTFGVHRLNNGTSLVISRGLAKESTRVPRLFNRPEIVSVTVIPPRRIIS